MTLLDFKKGQIVRHAISGCAATVIRPVKSRRVVTIEFSEGPRAGTWYDAKPINLKLEALT
jgi:hypothetical protein